MVIVFRSRVRPEHADERRELLGRMRELAQKMPGFVSYKHFVAEDGEGVSLIEFESAEHLQAWREHPEHRDAQRIGRERLYLEYTLQVCEPIRESRFRAQV